MKTGIPKFFPSPFIISILGRYPYKIIKVSNANLPVFAENIAQVIQDFFSFFSRTDDDSIRYIGALADIIAIGNLFFLRLFELLHRLVKHLIERLNISLELLLSPDMGGNDCDSYEIDNVLNFHNGDFSFQI